MKRFKLHHKIIAILLGLNFTFLSMNFINSHTYTTGVDNYHYIQSCFGGSFPIHLSSQCFQDNCYLIL